MRYKILKKSYKYRLVGGVTLIILLMGFTRLISRGSIQVIAIQYADSSQNNLQRIIDSVHKNIVSYTDLLYEERDLQEQIETLKKQNSNLDDSLNNLNGFNLEGICSELKIKENAVKIKSNLKAIYKKIDTVEGEKLKIYTSLNDKEANVQGLTIKIKNGEKDYTKYKQLINDAVENISGPGVLIVKSAKYRFYVARRAVDSVQIHNNNKKNSAQSIKDVIAVLTKQKREPFMVTNGGMYTPNYEAQGLLIENYKEIRKIDTLKPENKANLNFYLEPNGVFYIDSNGFNVLKTAVYKNSFTNKMKMPQFATQSGPMLLFDGTRNRNFKNGSQNLNIRSGVGLINKDKIVFIISDTKVNFYDFTSVFDDIFNCKNALYLDGAISKMYINETASGMKNPGDNDGDFGPIISISRIKK